MCQLHCLVERLFQTLHQHTITITNQQHTMTPTSHNKWKAYIDNDTRVCSFIDVSLRLFEQFAREDHIGGRPVASHVVLCCGCGALCSGITVTCVDEWASKCKKDRQIFTTVALVSHSRSEHCTHNVLNLQTPNKHKAAIKARKFEDHTIFAIDWIRCDQNIAQTNRNFWKRVRGDAEN